MPTVLDTYIENRARIQPDKTNNYGNAHGGVIMRFMDEVGAMSAMRFAGETCVTARVEGLDFLGPVPQGDIARVESWVFDAGKTSVRVRLRVDREDPRTGELDRTSDSCFVYVAVDDSGDPQPVPELTTTTERGEELRREGLDAEG